jgi:hypothetical protein
MPWCQTRQTVDTRCLRDMNLTLNAEKPNELLAEKCVARGENLDEAGRSRMKQLHVRVEERVKAGRCGVIAPKSNRPDFGKDSRLGTGLNISSLPLAPGL